MNGLRTLVTILGFTVVALSEVLVPPDTAGATGWRGLLANRGLRGRAVEGTTTGASVSGTDSTAVGVGDPMKVASVVTAGRDSNSSFKLRVLSFCSGVVANVDGNVGSLLGVSELGNGDGRAVGGKGESELGNGDGRAVGGKGVMENGEEAI